MIPARISLSKLKRGLKEYQVELTNFVLVMLCRAEIKVRRVERWYWDMLALARAIAWLMRLVRPSVSDPSLDARLMHRFFDILWGDHRCFPVPLQVQGRELLESIAALGQGFVCCSAHVPLIKLAIPPIRQTLGAETEVVVMVKYASENRQIDVWNDTPLPSLEAGQGVLLQTRSLLRRGGCLLLLADKEQGEYMSSSIFRFVGMVKSRIIMVFTHLMPDGHVLVQFVEAPAPECRNEEEIRTNLDFMARKVRSILAGDESADKVRASVMPLVQMNVAKGGREMDRIHLYSRAQLTARMRRMEQLLLDSSTTVGDRALYERRLKLMQDELQIRSQVLTRSEFGPDGQPLRPDGQPSKTR